MYIEILFDALDIKKYIHEYFRIIYEMKNIRHDKKIESLTYVSTIMTRKIIELSIIISERWIKILLGKILKN